ncbi:inositol 1,4,5-trisphosphate receptor-interacting protein-like 2 [Latimeria chalumnae]|uniref:inositol 1,4,5-trisphosphate receptor-interacting protein-like 2 n=1 Tax=Latimeria chalumnae TaxID=7897 RepID=UPI0003C17017|nr:PREDICTED: inositol 1,4,5-trisphosphate receptor-interacting protein-like 2 [Latimeria chalumnae]|eukprot:XP_006007767.1 PREDICTED: inositol 1,4,5-trisphosphate receptor-interacting protein-like 2 [Latimeria chalumnae]
MPVYSVNLKVFWPLVTCLCTAVLCLYHALWKGRGASEGCQEDGTSSFPLFKLSLVFLICYFFIKYCAGQDDRLLARAALRSDLQEQAKRSLLETYYQSRVRLSPHLLGHSKAHVAQIVSELIKVGRSEPQEASLIFRGDYIQIGSAYEQHMIHSPDCFDILVPLKLPPNLRTEPLLGASLGLPGPGRGEAICRLEAPRKSEWGKGLKSFGACFCTEGQKKRHHRHLSPALVLKWFHLKMQRCLSVIKYRFEERCLISLSVVEDRLILNILPRSDYICCHIFLAVRLIPAIHIGDSIFLVAQPWTRTDPHPSPRSEAVWAVNFSKLEQKFLSWVKAQAPANSCHLKCLQILKALRDAKCQDFNKNFSAKWNVALSSYALKTALFYLLLKGPLEAWDGKFLMERLEEFVRFLVESFQNQVLMHFFLGNSKPPESLSVPKLIKEACPVNLLAHFDTPILELVSLQLLSAWAHVHKVLKVDNQKSVSKKTARYNHSDSNQHL